MSDYTIPYTVPCMGVDCSHDIDLSREPDEINHEQRIATWHHDCERDDTSGSFKITLQIARVIKNLEPINNNEDQQPMHHNEHQEDDA